MPNKYFHVLGVATYVHHRGATTLPGVPPEARQGESILCLHGAGLSGSVFDAVLDALASRHSPLAFDQPGHGRSGGLDSLGSIERMATFTLALHKELHLEPSVLLGHGMGGAVALECALQAPEQVRALVLCASGARLGVADEVLELHSRVAAGKERRPFRRELFAPESSRELIQRGFLEEMKTDPRARYGDLLACQTWTPSAALAELRLPCLVVRGEHEEEAIREEAAQLAAAIPGARLELLARAGHMLPLEAPEELSGMIEGFLADLRA